MSEQAPIQDVNIELGDTTSDLLYERSKQTHANRHDRSSAGKRNDSDYCCRGKAGRRSPRNRQRHR